MIDKLPARERQLFETLYALKQATAAELQDALDDAPSNSAIRVMLRRLEAASSIRPPLPKTGSNGRRFSGSSRPISAVLQWAPRRRSSACRKKSIPMSFVSSRR